MSDNEPQYASREFQKFAKTWEFKHITSSSRYPRSNGLVKRTIQTVKELLSKALSSHQDPTWPFLKTEILQDSPARLLPSRNLRSTIPHCLPISSMKSLMHTIFKIIAKRCSSSRKCTMINMPKVFLHSRKVNKFE